jgi:hypothetical protein
MADISKHDSEEKGEGDTAVKGWVEFLVTRHSVGVHYLLERIRKFISRQKGRRLHATVSYLVKLYHVFVLYVKEVFILDILEEVDGILDFYFG